MINALEDLISTTNPFSTPMSSSSSCASGRSMTAELWAGRHTLGSNQEAPLGAFRERGNKIPAGMAQWLSVDL